jgi:hypothetical protein
MFTSPAQGHVGQPSWLPQNNITSPHYVGSSAEIFSSRVPRPTDFQAGILGLMNGSSMFMPFYSNPAITPMGMHDPFSPLYRHIMPGPLSGLGGLLTNSAFSGIEKMTGLPARSLSMIPWNGLTNPNTGESISASHFYQSRQLQMAIADAGKGISQQSPIFDPRRSLGAGFASTLLGYGKEYDPVAHMMDPSMQATFQANAERILPLVPTMVGRSGLSARFQADFTRDFTTMLATTTSHTARGVHDFSHDTLGFYGAGRVQVAESMGAAMNLGLINRHDMARQVLEARDRAGEKGITVGTNFTSAGGWALRTAGKLHRVSSDIFGEGGDASVKMMALDQLVGGAAEGLAAGEVASRGKRVSDFSQAMNVDAKTIANYVEGMKKLVENAGIASKRDSFGAAMAITEVLVGAGRQGHRIDAQEFIKQTADFSASHAGQSMKLTEAGMRMAQANGTLSAEDAALLARMDSGDASARAEFTSRMGDLAGRYGGLAAGQSQETIGALSSFFANNAPNLAIEAKGGAYFKDLASRSRFGETMSKMGLGEGDGAELAVLLSLSPEELETRLSSPESFSRGGATKHIRQFLASRSADELQGLRTHSTLAAAMIGGQGSIELMKGALVDQELTAEMEAYESGKSALVGRLVGKAGGPREIIQKILESGQLNSVGDEITGDQKRDWDKIQKKIKENGGEGLDEGDLRSLLGIVRTVSGSNPSIKDAVIKGLGIESAVDMATLSDWQDESKGNKILGKTYREFLAERADKEGLFLESYDDKFAREIRSRGKGKSIEDFDMSTLDFMEDMLKIVKGGGDEGGISPELRSAEALEKIRDLIIAITKALPLKVTSMRGDTSLEAE